jgi:hypothetical protein
MFRHAALIGLIAALIAASAALGETITPFNNRPTGVTLPSPDGAGKDLQTILNQTFLCNGCVSAVNDQQSAGMWQFSAFPYGSMPALAFEYTANEGVEGFGIWSDSNNDTDQTGRTLVPIFGGASQAGAMASIFFDIATQSLHVGTVNDVGGGIITGTYTGINPSRFGFYLERTGGIGGDATHFTVDQLNGGGLPQALAYRKPGSDTWAIAFEDLSLQNPISDGDYNDVVVKVESIQAVPEPSSVILLGAGLLGTALARRKLFRRA